MLFGSSEQAVGPDAARAGATVRLASATEHLAECTKRLEPSTHVAGHLARTMVGRYRDVHDFILASLAITAYATQIERRRALHPASANGLLLAPDARAKLPVPKPSPASKRIQCTKRHPLPA